MCFHLLRLIFSIGKFLALTPPSTRTPKIKLPQKLYSIFVSVILIAAFAYALTSRQFYTAFVPIKTIVCILRDSLSLTLTLVIILDVNFFKIEHWFHLLKDLGLTDSSSNSGKIVKENTIFVLTQSIFSAILVLTVVTWKEVYGWYYITQCVFELLQLYIHFLYTFLICVVLKMLSKRYRHIHTNIQHFQSRGTDEVLFWLKNFHKQIYRLGKTVDVFNEIFAWPVTLIVVLASLTLLDYLDWLFTTPSSEVPMKNVLISTNVLLTLLATVRSSN